MSYATLAQFRADLKNIPAGADNDALIQQKLDEATAAIDLEWGFSLLTVFGAAAAQDVQAAAGPSRYLTTLPAHEAGSITAVLAVYDYGTSLAWTEDPLDWTQLADGRLYRQWGWTPGGWYRITAKWGYSVPAATMKAVEKVCLEKAKDAWFARNSSASSNTAGVEGAGAIAVQRTWTDEQWRILQRVRALVGEW